MTTNDFRTFHNRLRIMLSIDLDELQQVGLMFNASADRPDGSWKDWRAFRANPCRYLIKAPDDVADKIWTIIERREKQK